MSVAATLLEIVACAASAGATTYLILQSREARRYAAAKAEELYTAVEAFEQGLAAYFAESCARIGEGRPYLAATDAHWAKTMRDSAKLRMLVCFYFPALWPQVRHADMALAATLGAMRQYHLRPADEAAVLALEQCLIDMRETMQAFKHEVIAAHRDGETGRHSRRRADAPKQALSMAA